MNSPLLEGRCSSLQRTRPSGDVKLWKLAEGWDVFQESLVG